MRIWYDKEFMALIKRIEGVCFRLLSLQDSGEHNCPHNLLKTKPLYFSEMKQWYGLLRKILENATTWMTLVLSKSLLIGISITYRKSAIKQSTVGTFVGDDCPRIWQGLLFVTTVRGYSLDWLCRWYVVYLHWYIIRCQVMTDQTKYPRCMGMSVWWLSNMMKSPELSF